MPLKQGKYSTDCTHAPRGYNHSRAGDVELLKHSHRGPVGKAPKETHRAPIKHGK